jgi:deoxyribonuclease-1-like protein
MRRFIMLVLMVAVIGGGFLLYPERDNIHSVGDAIAIIKTSLEFESEQPETEGAVPVRERHENSIRVASFNLGILGPTKLQDEQALSAIGKIIREFDIVALQEIRSLRPDTMSKLMDWINLDGDRYDYVVSHRLGRTDQKEQYAFVFDRTSIELDRSQSYVVNDPEDLLHREPFVVWCRVRGPEPEQAFTFSLVNVHTDPDEVRYELQWLDDVFEQVRDDGRGEDDVIMLGDLNTSDRSLGELAHVVGLHAVIQNKATNTRGTAQYDNILLSLPATSEFSGRGGVYDFYNQFDLTMEEALRISDHLPVWAEFSLTEGGEAGYVATQPQEQR